MMDVSSGNQDPVQVMLFSSAAHIVVEVAAPEHSIPTQGNYSKGAYYLLAVPFQFEEENTMHHFFVQNVHH